MLEAAALVPDCMPALSLARFSLGVIHTDGARTALLDCTKSVLDVTARKRNKKPPYIFGGRGTATTAIARVQVTV